MSKYNGSIELISGLKQKNDNDFPLVEAHAVAVYEESGEEVRLDDKLKQLKEASNVKDEIKQEIIQNAKSEVFEDERFLGIANDTSYLTNSLGNWPTDTEATVYSSITNIEKTLEDFKGDNDELNITYQETGSKLYLHTGDTPVVEEGPDYNIIAETVIVGGGGSSMSSQYNLKVEVTNASSFSVLKGGTASLDFDVVLTARTTSENETPEEITTENVTINLYKQDDTTGVFTLLKSEQQKAGRGKSIDVSSYLNKIGSNIFKVTVIYKETVMDSSGEEVILPTSRSKTWAIEVVDMYLSSNFEDSVAFTGGSNVNIPFLAYGNLSKTIYGTVDGAAYYEYTTSTSGRSHTMTIKAEDLTHGSHDIEIWCEGQVGEETIESKKLKFNIMFIEPGNNTPVIRLLTESLEGEQYSNIPIDYNVYKEDSLTNLVTIEVDGVQVASAEIGRTEQRYIYQPLTYGEKVITFKVGEVSKSLTFNIAKFPYEIAPITDSRLDLDFTPTGRSNQDTDYNVFKNNVVGKEDSYDWELSDNFDWVNGGWQVDANGDPYFCVKAGTTATFNYLLFNDSNTIVGANNTQGNGKEFKLIFKTTNVADPEAVWLNCISAPELGTQDIGLKMTMHNGYVSSSVEKLTIPYSEEDIIEFDLNIVPISVGTDGLPDLTVQDISMIMTYEDGTPAQPVPISSTATSFKQKEAVPIVIGSNYGDIHIYRMKAYNKFLSEDEILDNFIADARGGAEIASRFKRNQIADAITGKITAESLAEACPDLKIIKLSAPRFTNDKKDKVKGTTIQFIHKGGRPVEDNWIAQNAIHNGQGTSSNAYGYASRNLELNMKEDDCVITLGDGTTTTSKITLSETSYPTNYLNLKVNVASSEHCNNALLQHRFERYLPYTSAAELRDNRLKNTMNFFNAVMFIQETGIDADGQTVQRQEFDDNNWHFYSIGNIGDSKKTDKTRTSDTSDDNEFCVEIMDWNRYLSKFPTDTVMEAPKGGKTDSGDWKYDGLVRNDKLPYLFEKNEDGELVLTSDEVVNMDKIYYIDLLEHDDFSEDYTYGFRYTKGDDDNLDTDPIIAKNKAKWIEIYRFLTKELPTITDSQTGRLKVDMSTEEAKAWKAEFPKWVNLDAVLYYYLFTLRYTMVDNRAKNSFWHWGKSGVYNVVENPIQEDLDLYYEYNSEKELNQYESDYVRYEKTTDTEIDSEKTYYEAEYLLDLWDYDNDTALGIDNAGKLEMSYGVEDLDTDPNQAESQSATYFRAGDSLFFMRLVDCFSDEMKDLLATLESKNPDIFNSDSLIQEFDNSQSMFPERLWHEQYKRVYKRPYVAGSGDVWDNALAEEVDKRFLTDMMNGKKKYQRRQFERNQDVYMSSKLLGMKNRLSAITLRGAGDLSGANLNPAPDATITVTPYLNMYLNLGREINGKPYYSQRCKAGQAYEIPYPQSVLEFIYIRGANRIQSLGDLSKMYLQTATLSAGEKLKEIILGNTTEGYSNANLTELNISSDNKILEVLDLRNIPTLEGTLPVQGIPSLRKIYGQGTGYSVAKLPNRGLLEEVYLSSVINTLEANNLYYLHTLELENYNNLGRLIIDNCPKINTTVSQSIVEQAVNLQIVRITDIDWSLSSTEALHRLLKCKGVAEDGLTEITQSVLTGKVYVPAIRQAELDSFNAVWPELEVSYGQIIPQFTVTFRNEYDGKQVEILFDQGSVLTVADGPEGSNKEWYNAYGAKYPVKPDSEDGQYAYTFKEWRTEPEVSGENAGNPITSITITSNIVIYAHFSKQVKTYTVTWYEISTSATGTIQQEVEWGKNAIYEGEIPTKTVAGSNSYYLFAGWDKPLVNITANRDIYPIWEISNPYDLGNKSSNEMTAADIYGLKSISSAEGETPTGNLYSYIKDGDEIVLKTGYMPSYQDWIDSGKEVVLAENLVFDGTQDGVVLNDIQLFKEDMSFTLAIDFEMGYKASGYNYLVSCLKGGTNTGFHLASNANAIPQVYYNSLTLGGAVAFKAPTESRTHRDICVIRKIKGDNNLYVYQHNRFDTSAEPTLITLTQTTSLTFNENPLVLGGLMASTGTVSTKGVGTIHYAKLWYEDLGDEECKNICSWVYDDFEFEYVGCAGLNDDNYIPVKGTFLAKYLLDEPISYGAASGDYPYGYHKSQIREWLNNKVFKGVSIQWQQTIASTTLPCIQGKKDTNNSTDELLGSTNSTGNYFYLPAVCNLVDSQSISNLGTYGGSISFWEENNNIRQSYTTIVSGNADRVKTRKNSTDVERYWTRTPYNGWGGYIFGVTQNRTGSVLLGDSTQAGAISNYEYLGDTGTNTYYYNPNQQLNVLVAFSI